VSFKSLLIHRCDLVQRNVVTGTDDYGRDIYGESVIPGVPCRADQLRARSSRDPYGTDFIVENVVYFPPDHKVTKEMSVNNIVDMDGNPVLEGSFSIENLATVYGRIRIHHYEVSLQRNEVNA
jgi:hypothetical protein